MRAQRALSVSLALSLVASLLIALPSATVRTTITLRLEEADLLDHLRMQLRHDRGRSLTYGDVVGLALRRLSEAEAISKSSDACQT